MEVYDSTFSPASNNLHSLVKYFSDAAAENYFWNELCYELEPEVCTSVTSAWEGLSWYSCCALTSTFDVQTFGPPALLMCMSWVQWYPIHLIKNWPATLYHLSKIQIGRLADAASVLGSVRKPSTVSAMPYYVREENCIQAPSAKTNPWKWCFKI